MMAQQTVKFNNGNTYPILGLGTWKSKPNEVTQAVKDAIDVGYRHIDCAYVYQNETEVGAAITTKIKEGVIKRENIFVTSKLWNTYHRPERVEPALRKTLSDLGLQYLDLYLMHSPMAYKDGDKIFPTDSDGNILIEDTDYLDTWHAMESLVEKGLVKNIGVSNFNSQQIERVLSNCKIKPVTNQVECHPYLNQKKLSDFCKTKGVTITAYSSFGAPDRPNADQNEPRILEDPKIKEIAAKYKKSPAQIVLRHQVQWGHLVIPKSVTKSRIQENLDIFDFEINAEDMNALNDLNCNRRYISRVGFRLQHHKYYPLHIEF
ncbi:aldo-keto reductase family 1 member B1-like isoform X1 [Hylaeus anthracinus]|uniref:aldo-keto reductase family 1 member B1-like isoform X1 n=1 Tax=Hylaeus anthracinus TaxID=313031 RepID=UPI0023B8EEB6|nr:aldo-keto reductase family 1 member B1-like isoform X1 [Hylaeus anthracinus]